MKATLAAMPPRLAREKSLAACQRLFALPEFQNARTVMAYLAMPEEVNVDDVAHHLWRENRRFLVPKIGNLEQRHMVAVEIHSLEKGMTRGELGIRQPETSEEFPPGDIEFIIVPALAYDRKGGRLGRGGGFYDRFLASEHLQAITCGLAFSEQVIDELPLHAHDRPVDILVTDSEVLRF